MSSSPKGNSSGRNATSPRTGMKQPRPQDSFGMSDDCKNESFRTARSADVLESSEFSEQVSSMEKQSTNEMEDPSTPKLYGNDDLNSSEQAGGVAVSSQFSEEASSMAKPVSPRAASPKKRARSESPKSSKKMKKPIASANKRNAVDIDQETKGHLQSMAAMERK